MKRTLDDVGSTRPTMTYDRKRNLVTLSIHLDGGDKTGHEAMLIGTPGDLEWFGHCIVSLVEEVTDVPNL